MRQSNQVGKQSPDATLESDKDLAGLRTTATGLAHKGKTPAEAMLSEDPFRVATDHFPGLLWTSLPDGYIDFLNQRWLEYTGMELDAATGWGWQSALHRDDLPSLLHIWKGLIATGTAGEAKARLRRHDGVYRWFLFRAVPYYGDTGMLIRWYGQTTDIDDLKRAEALLAGEKHLLEMIAKGSPLNDTLDRMCRMLDEMLSGACSAVALLDRTSRHLHYVSAPNLPAAFIIETDHAAIDEQRLPGCKAVITSKPVIIGQIGDDPAWADYHEIALRYGIHASSSTPILSAAGEVLGALDLHSYFPRMLDPEQQSILDQLVQLASVAAERQFVDAALKESEERFRLMAETTPDVIWITDLHPERVRYVSPSYERLWGHRVEDIYSNPRLWVESIHPEDRGKVSQTFEQGIASGTNNRYDIEYRLMRKNGGISWIHERGVFMLDKEGKTFRASGISTDITVRKTAEAALHVSEERFSLAVAASADGIWDWDISSDVMFMSSRAQYICGLEPGETMRSWSDWRRRIRMHAEDASVLEQHLQSYLAMEVPAYDHEFRIQDRNSEYRWVRVRGQCVRNESGKPTRLAGSMSDIDLQKRTETSLEQARRLEALGTLAGGIAHDFNNILGAVLGYGEMALSETSGNHRLRRDLTNIITAGQRGRALVDRILAFSKSGVGERVIVHVNKVVRESIALVKATLLPGIKIVSTLEATKLKVLGDPTQIHQIMTNLITNAIQAMPNGGVLNIHLSTAHTSAERITVTGKIKKGNYIVLRISDTGIGIDAHVLGRIFDPFFTTKEVGVGTGLGLTLVHGIVADLGGGIDVSSVPGEGTSFTVFLPQAAAENTMMLQPVEPKPVRRTRTLPRGNGEHILVVDDEVPLLKLMAQILEDLNYVVSIHTSGSAALTAFASDPTRFDAVISDQRMPGMTGSALITEIRALNPAIPILLISGYLGDASMNTERDMHIAEILKKPVSRHELANSVARLFQF